jgi:hypothetical protein
MQRLVDEAFSKNIVLMNEPVTVNLEYGKEDPQNSQSGYCEVKFELKDYHYLLYIFGEKPEEMVLEISKDSSMARTVGFEAIQPVLLANIGVGFIEFHDKLRA